LKPALRVLIVALLAAAAVAASSPGAAQPAPQNPAAPAAQGRAAQGVLTGVQSEPSGEVATLTFFNRPIVVFRARVLGRGPAERAEGAERALESLAAQGTTGPVEWRPFDNGAVITIASRAVMGIAPPDVDELSGERVEDVAAQTVARLQRALGEAVEARSTGVLLRSAALASLVVTAAVLVLWGISRAHRAAADRLVTIAERTVAQSGLADVRTLRDSRLLDIERWLVGALAAVLHAFVIYTAIAFVLRRFPYTRPWGESMRGFLVTTLESMSLGAAHAVPGLVTVVVIVVVARTAVKLIALWFGAIERGQLKPRWMYPETAQPTRRLLTGLVWIFAAVVAYPYLPGSESDAFKGVSVFVGLMVTLGSSGIMNQIMSGFTITYSRALRVNDFVRIGDVEGSVTQLGVLSTKVRTPWHEEVTIPNAIVVSQQTTDYSRSAGDQIVRTPTSVTIGYDTPWRQVESLLVLAAERTPGLRREVKPFVLQTSLEDFYVKYTLLVALERQESRPWVLHALHANVQDLFNEYGVQIMSPHFQIQPNAPVLVPKDKWREAPAETKE